MRDMDSSARNEGEQLAMRNRLWTTAIGAAILDLGVMVLAGCPKDPRAQAGEGGSPGDSGVWKELTGKDLDALVKQQLKSVEKDAKTKSTLSRNFRKVERAGHVIAMLGNAAT